MFSMNIKSVDELIVIKIKQLRLVLKVLSNKRSRRDLQKVGDLINYHSDS